MEFKHIRFTVSKFLYAMEEYTIFIIFVSTVLLPLLIGIGYIVIQRIFLKRYAKNIPFAPMPSLKELLDIDKCKY